MDGEIGRQTIETTPAIEIERFVIRRHPAGIILVYIEAVAALLAVAAFFILISPDFLKRHSFMDMAWVVTLMIAIGLGVFFTMLVATYIYNQNRIIVTEHDIEEIIQRGLLFRRTSKLELSDVEDVTVSQSGFLSTLFGYGTLTVETAGHEENFIFPYCINPHYYAGRLLEARGKYVIAITESIKQRHGSNKSTKLKTR